MAARYFSALKPRGNMRVIEAPMVPKTYVANWFWADRKSTEKEPIGERIIEVPEDLEHFESRDSHATFIAYVPPGSLKRGEILVRGKSPDRAPACASCHGPDLRGLGAVPSIAGRSPSYVIRQLYELQTGVRRGPAAPPMKAAIEKLTMEELISIAAYIASRAP